MKEKLIQYGVISGFALIIASPIIVTMYYCNGKILDKILDHHNKKIKKSNETES